MFTSLARAMSFKAKLIALICTIMLLFGFALLLVNQITLSRAIFDEKHEQTREMVRSATGILSHFHSMEQRGELEREEAQEQAKGVIAAMLFGEELQDYFWINDFVPVMLLHPFRPDLQGQDVAGIADPNGVYLFREVVDVCRRHGEGFVRYDWQYYDDQSRVEPKISFVAEFKPWSWIVGTGVYVNDVRETVGRARTFMLLWTLAAIGIAFILAAVFAALIIRPIATTSAMLKDISEGEGDLTRRLSVTSSDEIGQLASSFNRFVEKLQGIIGQLSQNADTVASSATELSATSTQIASSAEEMSTQTATVAAATEEATTNINTISAAAEEMSSSTASVATAIEEMSASLNEVAANCQKELRIAADAATHARSGKEIMDRLGSAARSIGKVIEVINDIADQTNLLALNATIEAASAGEAGKGFAVVANEVKELAKQTAQATQEIGSRIEEMQSNTESAVKAIDLVTQVIEEVNTISQSIVSAVEEQSATINEIARNVSGVSAGSQEVASSVAQSAEGLGEVAGNISGFNAAIGDTSRGITQIKTSAEELAKLSENLRRLVGQFKI